MADNFEDIIKKLEEPLEKIVRKANGNFKSIILKHEEDLKNMRQEVHDVFFKQRKNHQIRFWVTLGSSLFLVANLVMMVLIYIKL